MNVTTQVSVDKPVKPLLALVTGGSGAIGSAIAKRLAADGVHVIVHANRSASAAQMVVDDIVVSGGQAHVMVFDITDAQSTRTAIEAIVAQNPIQILINNAGIHEDAVFAGMRPEQWQRVIDVSLNGFFNVTQPLMLDMLRTRYGRIVTVSSIAAIAGNRGQVNYAAAKAALHGASKALSLEVASRGVTVNVVAPGIIESPLTEDVFSPDSIKNMVPMKRAGTTQEVADLVGFLASSRASYITGQVISINGGMI